MKIIIHSEPGGGPESSGITVKQNLNKDWKTDE